jgi:hypothetical protein
MRLERLRALLQPQGRLASDERPPLTVIRSRRAGKDDVWGYHIAFTNSLGQLVWHTLLGAIVRTRISGPLAGPAHAVATLLEERLHHDRQRALARLGVSLREYLDLAARRERAIVGALQAERARLSASLLQGSLFDRRAERARAAQSAVLDEALLRCRARLDEVAASAQIAAGPGRLAFVLVRR